MRRKEVLHSDKTKGKGGEMNMHRDRRRESRLPYCTSITLTFTDSQFIDQETRDVSVTGAFVTGLSGPQKGDCCDVKLRLTGEASELTLKLNGEVVRVEKDGIALEFVDVRRDCFYHLKNISYVVAVTPDDIVCTNFKKPKSVSIKKLTQDLQRLELDDDEDDAEFEEDEDED